MSMPVMMLGSRSRPACSRKVAGSSVCPARGINATSAPQIRTAKVSVPYMATCQSSVSATNLPIEVTKTIATENAPYTTEMASEVCCGDRSSGMYVTPTASSAPETEPRTMREINSTWKLGANAMTRLPSTKTML